MKFLTLLNANIYYTKKTELTGVAASLRIVFITVCVGVARIGVVVVKPWVGVAKTEIVIANYSNSRRVAGIHKKYSFTAYEKNPSNSYHRFHLRLFKRSRRQRKMQS